MVGSFTLTRLWCAKVNNRKIVLEIDNERLDLIVGGQDSPSYAWRTPCVFCTFTYCLFLCARNKPSWVANLCKFHVGKPRNAQNSEKGRSENAIKISLAPKRRRGRGGGVEGFLWCLTCWTIFSSPQIPRHNWSWRFNETPSPPPASQKVGGGGCCKKNQRTVMEDIAIPLTYPSQPCVYFSKSTLFSSPEEPAAISPRHEPK